MSLRGLAVFLLVPLLCSTAAPAQTSRTVERAFDLTDDGTVTVDTYKGHVDVTTWDKSRVRVSVRIQGEQASVEKTKIRFDASADDLKMQTDYDALEKDKRLFGLIPVGSIHRPSTQYTLTVPRSASVSLDTYSASASVSDLRGVVRFDAFSGNLMATDVRGPVYADTYSGEADVTRSSELISVDTFSGNLRADSLSGRVEFSAYSGSATIGFVDVTGDCNFDTFSGHVTLAFPPNRGGVIETDRGNLESDVPLQIDRMSDDRVRATVGGGGPHLWFETFSGVLSVRPL